MIASLYNGKRIETEKHKLKAPDLPDRILFADQKEDKEEGVREDQSQIPAKMKSKGMNLEEGATTIERNSQIGGHKA